MSGGARGVEREQNRISRDDLLEWRRRLPLFLDDRELNISHTRGITHDEETIISTLGVLGQPLLDVIRGDRFVVVALAQHRHSRRHEDHLAAWFRRSRVRIWLAHSLADDLDRDLKSLARVGRIVASHQLAVVTATLLLDLREIVLGCRLADA